MKELTDHTLTVTPDAAQILLDQLEPGYSLRLEIVPCGWSSVSFRLVQTQSLSEEDVTLRDPATGITLYLSEFISRFFENLEIFPSRVMDDGSLVIREKHLQYV